MPATLPEVFGRYRVLSRIGEGGMGTVYLAEDTRLRRQVALKVPRFAADEDPVVIQRFYREARLAAQIRHPSLCPVYDADCQDGTHYLTMAFIQGRPLAEHARGGQAWPTDQAVAMVQQLASALHALHVEGFVHRDLKPANVMVQPDGTPVLLDFGLARSMAAPSQQVTNPGASVGTPAYMAPEQVAGEDAAIGPHTDVWALGVILYQLLTGQLPFNGATPMEMWARILHREPQPPSTLRPGLDPRLDSALAQILNKDPKRRPASMLALIELLGGSPVASTQVMASAFVPAPPEVVVVEPLADTATAALPSAPTDHPTTDYAPLPPPPSKRRRRWWEESGPRAHQTKMSKLAIASLVVGLLSLLGIPLAQALSGTVVAFALAAIYFVLANSAVALAVLALRAISLSKGRLVSPWICWLGIVLGGLSTIASSVLFVASWIALTRQTTQYTTKATQRYYPTGATAATGWISTGSTMRQPTTAELSRERNITNLRQIGLAMKSYNSGHNGLPPAASVDSNGRPGLSWRVHLLPYLDQNALYRRFKLDEPWDSPHNKALLRDIPAVYRSPSDPYGTTDTPYRVFVGKEALFSDEPSKTSRDIRLRRLETIADGTSNTVLVVEDSKKVPWTKPDELPFSMTGPLPELGYLDRERPLLLMADGSVRTPLRRDFPEKVLRRMICPDDGQPLDP